MNETNNSPVKTTVLIVFSIFSAIVLMFLGSVCKMVPGAKVELTEAFLIDSAGKKKQMMSASDLPDILANKRGFNDEFYPGNASVIIQDDFTVLLIHNNRWKYGIIPWSDSASSFLTMSELREAFQVIDSNDKWTAISKDRHKEWYIVDTDMGARSILNMSQTARKILNGNSSTEIKTANFRFAGETYALSLTLERSQWLSPSCHWSFPGSP